MTFFFFQAEDGIRDRDVTGVQTCALPICDNWFSILQINNLSNETYDGYTIYSSWSGSNHYPAPERNLKLSLGYRF